MITIKLFGTLCVDSGLYSIEIEKADRVKDIYDIVFDEICKKNPEFSISKKFLKSCLISINGVRASKKASINDGDIIGIYTPCAGG